MSEGLPAVPSTLVATSLTIVLPLVTRSAPSLPGPSQVPMMQLPAQVLPQVPQFDGSEPRSTSQPSAAARLQSAKPESHTKAHVPERQAALELAGVGQATPHPPQCAGSEEVRTQLPPQSTKGAMHDVVQVPMPQISPAPQVTPAFGPAQSSDAPQKARSVSGSTQRPPQATCPEGQDSSQTPAAHTSPAAQLAPAFTPTQSPAAPQYIGSLSGLTQRPPHWTCPAGHRTLQTPLAQASPAAHGVPASGPAQSPLAPQ